MSLVIYSLGVDTQTHTHIHTSRKRSISRNQVHVSLCAWFKNRLFHASKKILITSIRLDWMLWMPVLQPMQIQ